MKKRAEVGSMVTWKEPVPPDDIGLDGFGLETVAQDSVLYTFKGKVTALDRERILIVGDIQVKTPVSRHWRRQAGQMRVRRVDATVVDE